MSYKEGGHWRGPFIHTGEHKLYKNHLTQIIATQMIIKPEKTTRQSMKMCCVGVPSNSVDMLRCFSTFEVFFFLPLTSAERGQFNP